MEFLNDYGLFLAKIVTLIVGLVVVVAFVTAMGQKGGRRTQRGHIEVTKLNEWYQQMAHALKKVALDSHFLKQEAKQEKRRQKRARKEKGGREEPHKRVYVLNFDGDMKASATDNLREEITTVLSLARPSDEVVLRLESTGGMVHSYGLAASQLRRIRDKGIPLTACVDKVAASGGYMMACVAERILAAPFSIIGSIGVVGQLPNFHRLLQRIPVDYEMQTAGEYKRNLSLFAENTDKGREKFAEELEITHQLFKSFIKENRSDLDVDQVATGETWYGREAREKGLIDDVRTSDDYLTGMAEEADIFEVKFVQRKSLPERLGIASQETMDRLLLTWWERLQTSRFFS